MKNCVLVLESKNQKKSKGLEPIDWDLYFPEAAEYAHAPEKMIEKVEQTRAKIVLIKTEFRNKRWIELLLSLCRDNFENVYFIKGRKLMRVKRYKFLSVVNKKVFLFLSYIDYILLGKTTTVRINQESAEYFNENGELNKCGLNQMTRINKIFPKSVIIHEKNESKIIEYLPYCERFWIV